MTHVAAAALDTNILVRILVKDDIAQTKMAVQLLNRYAKKSETLFIPITVSLELEWVLRSRYHFDKAEVFSALSSLLATLELAFESEAALEQALESYSTGSADYADYVHIALSQKAKALPFWTLDTAASKASGGKLLS
jgi:predicted nucleic-acid-binding protein